MLAPRGLGAAAAMLLIGQLARYRLPTKPFWVAGFLFQMLLAVQMATWNLQVDYWQRPVAHRSDQRRLLLDFPAAVGRDAFLRVP